MEKITRGRRMISGDNKYWIQALEATLKWNEDQKNTNLYKEVLALIKMAEWRETQ